MPINTLLRVIRTAVAAIVVLSMAVTILLAQDDLESLRQAAEQGDADAQYNLGVMYFEGRSVLKDVAEAARWFRLAAEQGDASAQHSVGAAYENGIGVLKDDAEAVRWYRLAAGQGHVEAQRLMGARYLEGRGVLKDLVLAHMWLNIANANGDEPAREGRDLAERLMGHTEISRATELARTCMDSDYQDCEP